jgi:6,7-dimethyl-8-ribityllumazine synthase
MAGNERAVNAAGPELDGSTLRIAVVCSRFNDRITWRLLDGARRGLAAARVPSTAVTEVWVPGAFEVPITAKAFATSGRADGVIALGCVIRGDTTHYDLVAGGASSGLQLAQMETGVPMAFGVLTTEDLDQALARSEDAGGHNVGEECAAVVVEMATLLKRIKGGDKLNASARAVGQLIGRARQPRP